MLYQCFIDLNLKGSLPVRLSMYRVARGAPELAAEVWPPWDCSGSQRNTSERGALLWTERTTCNAVWTMKWGCNLQHTERCMGRQQIRKQLEPERLLDITDSMSEQALDSSTVKRACTALWFLSLPDAETLDATIPTLTRKGLSQDWKSSVPGNLCDLNASFLCWFQDLAMSPTRSQKKKAPKPAPSSPQEHQIWCLAHGVRLRRWKARSWYEAPWHGTAWAMQDEDWIALPYLKIA